MVCDKYILTSLNIFINSHASKYEQIIVISNANTSIEYIINNTTHLFAGRTVSSYT